MKRIVIFFSSIILLLGLFGAANATTVNYLYAVNGNEFTSPYSGAIVEDFEGATEIWNWTGDGAIVKGSTGINAAPFGVSSEDATWYVTVPFDLYDNEPNFATAELGGYYNYFGIWWGSVDTYNTLSFYNDSALVASFTGSQIVSNANGNQTSPLTNLYVNFLYLPTFNKFEMASTNYAFEADNIAVGVVPEPATMLLLGLGLIGLAGARRLKK